MAQMVDLAEMTQRLGLPADQQSAVAAFMGSSGPWTEKEARELVRIYRNTHNGVYQGR